jgi:hypothetical protein
MHTKILMILSAVFMAALGLAASFLPKEILTYAGAWDEGVEVFVVQALGALCLGFAILNWSARNALIGGMHNRPIALGNFMHFLVVAVTLIKVLLAGFYTLEVMAAAAIYAAFAMGFGLTIGLFPTQKAPKK